MYKLATKEFKHSFYFLKEIIMLINKIKSVSLLLQLQIPVQKNIIKSLENVLPLFIILAGNVIILCHSFRIRKSTLLGI